MKKLANLKGVITLSKIQQKNVTGGIRCTTTSECSSLGSCYICTASGICFNPPWNNCDPD